MELELYQIQCQDTTGIRMKLIGLLISPLPGQVMSRGFYKISGLVSALIRARIIDNGFAIS
jgi:hypothetical protein